MELRQLRYLVVLAEEEHFTRAAARLRIAQPALSQQIQKLEAELQIALFDRTTRRVRLTDAGALLRTRAKRVLTEIDDARAELQQLTNLVSGRVTIGLTQTPGPVNLLRLLGAFHERFPAVKLTVREDLSSTLAEALRNDQLDVAFLSLVDDVERHGLELQPLAEEPLVVVLPRDHRLADRGAVTIADLRDEAFVAFSEGATIRRAVGEAARNAGFAPTIAFETREVTRSLAIVAEGLGVSVLPRSDADTPGSDVRIVELHGPSLTHRISLAWREGKRHAPAARAFLTQARGADQP